MTGADALRELNNAGNVLRSYTAFKLSVRLPPLIDGREAGMTLQSVIEVNAPSLSPQLEDALKTASQAPLGRALRHHRVARRRSR